MCGVRRGRGPGRSLPGVTAPSDLLGFPGARSDARGPCLRDPVEGGSVIAWRIGSGERVRPGRGPRAAMREHATDRPTDPPYPCRPLGARVRSVHRRPRRHFAAVSGSRPTTRRETALAAARYGPEGTADGPPHQAFDRANRQGELLDPPRLAVVDAEARTPTPSSAVGGNRRCRGPRSGSNSLASRGPKFSVPSYHPRP